MAVASGESLIIKALGRKFVHFEREIEGTWKGPFYFIHAADTQFGMIASYFEKSPTPAWQKEIALTKKAIAAVNKMSPRPRFFVVCGDLVDAFPETDPDTRSLQEADFKKVFSELDASIPLVCVCGNHDVGNTPTVQTVSRYRTNFGDDYYSFWCGGVFFIVLNSQFYYDASLVEELAAEQAKWLDEQLAQVEKLAAKHICVFQHIPPFNTHPDEPKDNYFNWDPVVRKPFLDKLKTAGVRSVFCGHLHKNAGGRDGPLEVIVTSAIGHQLGDDTHGLRVVRVLEDSIDHKYYGLDDIPIEIPI